MGSASSKKHSSNLHPTTTMSNGTPEQQPGMETFLLKHPGSCSGMFWRDDPHPSKKGPKSGGDNWPRNGSLLMGNVHTDLPDMKWLEVDAWKPAGKSQWITQCQGLWMPFEQGGLLLHKQL
jgi:hypothetical protein